MRQLSACLQVRDRTACRSWTYSHQIDDGARFDAAYEIYAHIAVAEREGMKPGAAGDPGGRPEAE